jgi:hypothetical protein
MLHSLLSGSEKAIHIDVRGCANELGNPLVGYAKQVSSISQWNTDLDQLCGRFGSSADRGRLSFSESATLLDSTFHIFSDSSREANNVRSTDFKRSRISIEV